MRTRTRLTAGAKVPQGPIVAPERFRLWKAGSNPGDYGESILTPAAAERVMAEYQRRGNPIAIDIEHNTNPEANPGLDPSKPPPTGGYCEIEVVQSLAGPEVWCSSVRWSDYARHQIESGERCCVSPDWDIDPTTREPIRLNKISLVLEPGTWGIGLLASRAAQPTEKRHMDLDTLKSALAAATAIADTAEDPAIKAAAQEFADTLAGPAAALGLDLSTEPAPASTDPATAGADEEERAPALAVAASRPRTVPQKPVRATASKPLTAEDVQRLYREERAKENLLAGAANRPGMTPALRTLLASRSLAEVKAFVSALPVPAATTTEAATVNATASRGGSVPSTPIAAQKPEALDPVEEYVLGKIDKQMGITPERLAAAKEAAAKGTLGVTSVAKLRASRAAVGVAK